MECIFEQSRLPDELIIVDGGSTDGTFELLSDFKPKSPIPMHIFQENGCNISRGRNLAISHAKYPIIAVTDFGCRSEKNWLRNLLFPFEKDISIQMVGGWYNPEDQNGNSIDDAHGQPWIR